MRINKILSVILYLYIFLPFLIFLAGWIKPCIAFPALFLFALGLFYMTKTLPQKFQLPEAKIIIVAIIIIAFWTYLSGIGGFVFQNSDHLWRNATFEALVNNTWPVRKEIYENEQAITKSLIYYIGFWLPSSIIGKIFGIKLGYIFQYFWAVLGLFLFFCLVNQLTNKNFILNVIIFIFFSGLDVVGVLIKNGTFLLTDTTQHIEWWSSFQFSSMTTQLFWVFNQAIYAWVLTVLILLQDNNKTIIALWSTGLLCCTLPFVGMIPYLLYVIIKNICINKRDAIKDIFSYYNIIMGGIIGILSFLFLRGNSPNQNLGFAFCGKSIKGFVFGYLLFLILEVFIYFPLIYQITSNKKILILTGIVLTLCPLITVGDGYDFCMRASIPALIVLYLFINNALQQINLKSRKYILLVVLYLIGSITPIFEINRTCRETLTRYQTNQPIHDGSVDESSLFIDSQYFSHYSGEINDSFFFEYLAK